MNKRARPHSGGTNHVIKSISLFLFFAFPVVLPGMCGAQTVSPDSVFASAQRKVNDGDASAGRATVDSMLRVSRRGSPAYAEALFWRASLAPTAQQSEQDYRRLIVEYPLYVRTGDVLLRLAQLELFRGNRDAALVHLRRIQTEHPEFANQAATSYWLGRTYFEKNDLGSACGMIADAKRLVRPGDVELKNQIDYQDQQCVGVVITSRADLTNNAGTPEPLTISSIPPASSPLPVPSAGSYSVQIAAYNRESQAKALASRLSRRGFSARVDGAKAPFRVRIGKYRTRAEASAAQLRIKKSGVSGIVVKAD